MTMKTLFNTDDLIVEKPKGKQCRTCKYLQKWACGGSFFFYCEIRKSNRTQNGLLKVKCKNEACNAYKEEGGAK